ncbi:MAG TPA: T9SS type A sorting domain-containing protein, partial [Chitinophagales bacterium]|nr:T9SS type A sorting domain-containing protein [Chitinophagales bacterium]
TQGSTSTIKAQALAEAVGAANVVKGQGSHIFVIGLPNPILPEGNVQQVSGPDRYPDVQNDFTKGDYSIASSQTLENDLKNIALLICRADLRLAKTVNTPISCPGAPVTFTLTITNDGLLNTTGVQVKDYLPNGYNYISDDGGAATTESAGIVTWNVGNLNYLQSKSLQITATVNASGNYKNTAQVTASSLPDGDSAPNNDDGDQSEDDEAKAIINTILNCDDGNPCTADGCANGVCTHSGGNCDDGNACTTDACVNGICTNTPILCNDNNACTNDFCLNGNCSHPQINCSDTDNCTIDGCSNGTCTHTPFTCNDGNPCTIDQCAGTGCRFIPVNCNDNNSCTIDVCVDGTCQNAPINCEDADLCTADGCSNGSCFHNPIPGCANPCDTMNCNDDDSCTVDLCVNSVCVHTPIDCDDANPNTIDVCFQGQCIHICNDNNPCTIDTVINGVCTTLPLCNDDNACTIDACVNGNCTNTPLDCSDSEEGTVDVCVNGQCIHTCDDQNPCTIDTEENGACVFTPNTCNDNNPCTIDACSNGNCIQTPITCDDGNPNTADNCVDGTCVHTPINCNDNNPCTADALVNGNCVFTLLNCDDGDFCTIDQCIFGACIHTLNPCTDNDLCTTDGCVNGSCRHTEINCDDGDPVTIDACVNGVCIHTPLVCGDDTLKIIFVMDESGSIVGSGAGTSNISAQVRGAASGILNALSETGAHVAIVEFSTTARRATVGGTTSFLPVTAQTINFFQDYIFDANATADNNHYDPEDYLSTQSNTFTNWEDALQVVQSINAGEGPAPLVLFFTDGFPTAYNNASGGVVTGSSATHNALSLAEADAAAYGVESQGSHIFVVGVPNPILPEANVQAISGPKRYPDAEPVFTSADYSISSSQTLVNDLTQIGLLLCHADIRLSKTVNTASTCNGSTVVFTLTAMNTGLENATGVEVKDYLPSGYAFVSHNGGASASESGGVITWNVGSLTSFQSKSLQITAMVNSSGNYKNTAQVTACDQLDADSTPNNDDGDQSEDDEASSSVVVDCYCNLKVSSLTLVYECALGTVGPLFDGKIISRDTLCRFNVRADLCQLPVGSVKFVINGTTKIENTAPYALYGDQPVGCYKPWIPNPGNYTLSVTAYSGSNATGTAGTPLVVHFTVLAGSSNTACLAPPTVDCAGKVGGTAFLDDCGICSGGTTGHAANSDQDNCGVCFGNNSTCCTTDANCNDNSVCTLDKCLNGNCSYFAIPVDDNNACTQDLCNAQTGIQHTLLSCDDNNACTQDFCDTQQGCQHLLSFPGCCQSSAECNDNDPCTADSCTNGTCTHTGGSGTGTPSYLKVVNPSTSYRKMRLGYSSTGLFSPKYNVGAGGNNQLCFTLKDASGTAQWSKIKVKPQGASSPVIYLGSYVPSNPGTGFFTVCIPLSVFTSNDFTQISYVELQCYNAAAFEIHIQKVEFNGGATPFLWFGDPKVDNFHDGTTGSTSELITTTVIGQPCGASKLSSDDMASQFQFNMEETTLSAYPNPFNDEVTILFKVPEAGKVKLEILSMEGKRIAVLFEESVERGEIHTAHFRAGYLPNGMYFYRLLTESGELLNRKLLLIR